MQANTHTQTPVTPALPRAHNLLKARYTRIHVSTHTQTYTSAYEHTHARTLKYKHPIIKINPRTLKHNYTHTCEHRQRTHKRTHTHDACINDAHTQ